jgi:hypothetical protein
LCPWGGPEGDTKLRRLTWIALAGIVLGIGAFLIFNLRTGQEWDGDYALYLMHAQNIVSGKDYADTGYIFNPANAIHPAAYPPGLPLLFAPVTYFFGTDVRPLKIECIVALGLFLVVYWLLARAHVGKVTALALVAAFGLHWFIVDSTNSPGAEFPFLLFCYAALLSFERLQAQAELPRSRVIFYVVVAALATALAYLTRTVAILLFPAAACAAVFRSGWRLISRTTLLTAFALACAGSICVAMQLVFRADVTTYVHYFDQFSIHEVLDHAADYWRLSTTLLGKTRPERWFGAALALTAVVGFAARLRKPTVLEFFFGAYVALLIVYPITLEMARYEMPIWPLLFMYVVGGLALLTSHIGRMPRQAVMAAVLVTVGVMYFEQLQRLDLRPVPYSVTNPQSQQMFDAVRQLPPDARILARKPTIVALYTDHDTAIWPEPTSQAQFIDYLRASQARYIIQDIPQMTRAARRYDPLKPFVEQNRSMLTPVFANEWFTVYQVDWQRSPVLSMAGGEHWRYPLSQPE